MGCGRFEFENMCEEEYLRQLSQAKSDIDTGDFYIVERYSAKPKG